MPPISTDVRDEPHPPAAPRRSPGPATRAGRVRWGLRVRAIRRLSPGDRDILWLYLSTRIGIWVTAYCARWLFPSDPATQDPGALLAPFQHWDWDHFQHIADQGYFPGQAGPWQSDWDNREAFFPGFPLVLRAVHLLVPDWGLAGLTISFVSGAVAVLALARITRHHLPDAEAGRRAVLFFLVSPCAVFLAVGYTEALFLALALPAWLAAQRHHWPLAMALTAAATAVRVSGLFLAAALAAHFLLTLRSTRNLRPLPWLALPALPLALFSWYLRAHTGDWMAWKHAQERGWFRSFHTPWEAWSNTWTNAFGHAQSTGYAFMFQAELVTMVIGVALLVVLARKRRWPETVYVALSLCALGTSFWYVSIPRAALLWWPLWIALAAWSLRSPRFKTMYLCTVAPVSTVFALTFLTGRWTG
ncbi:mannosyltransferase family protein [Streptomyces rimosus]|uniref:mannosyltransferase family protein n=1 Tax=Streptomyces rimosus TaxID=1927 RepID=UPI0004C7793A|nr:mannosyltransferase family protein [Streptomyces rimosus]